MSKNHTASDQLGFDNLLAAAETENRNRIFERETGHLPATMNEGLAYYRDLLKRHHDAMMAADASGTMELRKDAHNLAVKLNGGRTGILMDHAPGDVLARETAAGFGSEPLWGQNGDFIVESGVMKVRIEMRGIFGIGGAHCYWPGFSAHAVERDKPFLSATGYRSFLGLYAEPCEGMTPSEFVRRFLGQYVEEELHGKLCDIDPC